LFRRKLPRISMNEFGGYDVWVDVASDIRDMNEPRDENDWNHT